MMTSTVALIFSAIQLVAPQLSSYTAKSYAIAIDKQISTTTPDISYLTYITIIMHESRFDTNAISHDGMDWGLMQVRALYYKSAPTNLLNAEANLRAGAYVLKESGRVCARMLKREPTLEESLSVYTGSLPSCRPNKLTRILVDYQVCLENEVERGVDKNECNFN